MTGFPPTQGNVGGMLRTGILRSSIHRPVGTHPLVVCRSPIAKEYASANQGPPSYSVRDGGGWAWEGLSQSEASLSLGAESTVVCYQDPYKLRCARTSGSVLEFLLKQILRAGAVGGTDRLLGHLSSQGRRLPLGQSGHLL